MLQHAIVAVLAGAVLSPFSYYAGLAARALQLPQITGYLASGIICGPYVLNLLTHEALSELNIIEGACLAIIGLAAGAELNLLELQRLKKPVTSITLAICSFTWALCYGTFMLLGAHVPVLPGLDSLHLVAVASLGSTIMMARSPASAIAVLKDLDGKGTPPAVLLDALRYFGFERFSMLNALPSWLIIPRACHCHGES